MALVAPFLPYDRLRVVAESFLNQHHSSGEIPVPIEKIVEFRLHLDIVPVPGHQARQGHETEEDLKPARGTTGHEKSKPASAEGGAQSSN